MRSLPAPEPCWIALLDDETLEVILRRLSLIERVRTEIVCTRWRRLLRQPSLWAQLDEDVLEADAKAHGLEYWLGRGHSLIVQAVEHVPGAVRVLRNVYFGGATLQCLAPCLGQLEALHCGDYADEPTTVLGALDLANALVSLSLPQLRTVDLSSFSMSIFERPSWQLRL